MIHTRYDSYGRLVGLVYSQGTTVLASYAWTYSEGSSLIANPQSLIPSSWLPNGGLPAGTSVATGQGMLPVSDTSGVADALFVSTYYSDTSLLTSCTSVDGTVTYTYDATGQLIGARYTGGQSDEAYSYDANGNRETANGSSYVTGAGNRLISDGTYTYSYDAEGNRTARYVDGDADGVLDAGDTDITEYGWDSRHRLVEVTDRATYGGDPTQIVNYLYDVENRLVGEKLDSNGDGVVDHQTYFVYDGHQIVAQFDKDGSAAVTGADLSHRYLWGAAVDQVLADEQVTSTQTAGNVVWPLADQLGTARDLATYNAQTGTTSVANHRVFDSYGNLVSQTNAAVDYAFGFTGFLTDKATGFDMSQTRPYDPRTGRWTQPDLIGLLGRDTNLYRYVANSPTNFTDPTGCLTPNARTLFDRYNFLQSLGLSDGQMVAAIIQEALLLTGGNAQEAFALVYEIRNSMNGIHDNDLWACADHFFQSWTLRNHVSTGLLAGIGASFANDGYAILKSIGFPVGRDNPSVPPSPLTGPQYSWGNKGSWAAFWYSANLTIGSPEWRDFLKWLDKWAERGCY